MSEGQQVALVTGASSGIGAATAALLAERGYRVFGTSRRAAPDGAPAGVEMLVLDVRSDASVDACVEALLGRAGRIDVLVNNAGFALSGESEGTSIEQAREQFETNFFGVVRMINAVLPVHARARARDGSSTSARSSGSPASPCSPSTRRASSPSRATPSRCATSFATSGSRSPLIEPGSVTTRPRRRHPAAEAPRPGLRPHARCGPGRRSASASRRASRRRASPRRSCGPSATARPRLRYRVGREATWIPRVKAVAPPARFEATTRRMFGLDAAAEARERAGGRRQ